jgi:branched-chain amino acid transport system ATP-binding protein
VLELTDVHAGYENRDVLHGLSFSVPPGAIVAVVGVNGAGKSTTLKVISGLLRARHGTLSVDGRVLRGGSAGEAVRAGVAHVPEGRQVFPDMTVRENLQLGGYSVAASKLKGRLDEALGIFPELSARLGAYAGSLSGGQQQMLAIARGLMSDPRYILLDEPSLGLAPQVITRIFEVIVGLREAGKGVLLVEQNGQLALGIAQRALLLESGTITLTGTGAELLANAEVIDRYLGVGTAAPDSARQRDWTGLLSAALAESSGLPGARGYLELGLRGDLGQEGREVGHVPLDLLLQGEPLLQPGARSGELHAPGVERARQVAAQVGPDRVALLARLAGARGDHQGDAADVGGQADGAHVGALLPRPRGGGAQHDADQAVADGGNQVAAVGRLRVAPAEEVQVVPGLGVQVARHMQPLGLALAAVHEGGPDLLLGQRLHDREG